VCYDSTAATRISYFLHNSSSTSSASCDVAEPTRDELRPYLSFSGYNGTEYALLSADETLLYARKHAFIFLVMERISFTDAAQLPSLLETTIRSRECRLSSLFQLFYAQYAQ